MEINPKGEPMTQTKKEIAHEADVVEALTLAAATATEVFGAQSNVFAVQEIYEYHQLADADSFGEDLARVYGYAKVAFKTETPTPEQVFLVFDKIFNDEDDDEE
jgi:hypothetical protein